MILRPIIALLVAIIVGEAFLYLTHADILSMAFAFLLSFFITKWILERYV